jgi:histidinol-phosphatase (PHP family)
MLADYHTHTFLCGHATGKPEEYLATAERKGISEFGVSDHVPWPEGFDTGARMSADKFARYMSIIDDLRESRGNVRVLRGIEIDWVPGRMDEVARKLAGYGLDYIIGSVHYVHGLPFDNPVFIHKWREPEIADKIWNSYAAEMVEFINQADFDVIGHIDLPKKFGIYPSNLDFFYDKMHEVFELAASRDIAVEINTAGLRKDVKEIYPSRDILKIAYSKGVRLCFGSDAHAPGEVGYAFDKALALAASVGYTEMVAFEKRERRTVKIGSGGDKKTDQKNRPDAIPS